MSGHREAFGFGYSSEHPGPAEMAALAEKVKVAAALADRAVTASTIPAQRRTTMFSKVRNRPDRDERGTTFVEYSMLLSLVFVAAMGWMGALAHIADSQFHASTTQFNVDCSVVIIPGQTGPAIPPPCPGHP